MLLGMEENEYIQYWIDSSDDDFKAMTHLLEKGDYTWSLFIVHLVLEKLLKAYYVKSNSKKPIFIHDLVRIAEKGNFIKMFKCFYQRMDSQYYGV